MRLLPTKHNSLIVLLLSMLFLAPFLTSFLLDLNFIATSITRSVLIYYLMLLETAITIILLIYVIKQKNT